VLLVTAMAAAKSSTVKSSVAKKSLSKAQTVTTVAQLTGKRGTLKRRRQLQQLIEHQQQLHSNDADLFSTTPYRSQQLITVSFFHYCCLLVNEFSLVLYGLTDAVYW